MGDDAVADAQRSFVLPVFLMLTGLVLGILAIAAAVGPIVPWTDDGTVAAPNPTRPWVAAGLAAAAIASVWWGLRTLRQPTP